ncbi:MAG TPA: hypothetical protein VFN36_06790 [Solirubrobacteraceae bacterium]|nr:hypothetical protein [Solirubrobacteraceae bacterium]
MTFTRAHLIRRTAPTAAAAALALAYLIVAPPGADLPAQLLRVRLFAAEGLGVWNNWWYGGQYVLGYSVLFPPLGWLLGPRLLAALASVGTAAAAEALAHARYGDDAWVGAIWLGAGTCSELLSGRLTFALGLCGAVLAALFLERRRPRWAAVCACAATLASPVAGLFAALAGAAVLWRGLRTRDRRRERAGAAVAAPALAIIVVVALLFPTGGEQPFAAGTLGAVVAAGALLLLLAPGATLTAAIVMYLGGCLLAFLIPTPLGSNAARLGELLAGPLVALTLVPRRAWLLLALAAAPLAYLQWHSAISDLRSGSAAARPAYYRPLLRLLRAQPGVWRVEVPFTAGHWESDWLAAAVPLARGWERQTDIADDRLFYGGRLTAARYHAWLSRLAVRYVAVPDVPPDPSAVAERRLIRGGLSFLRLLRRLPHWTVYAVRHPTPLATGAGRVRSLGPDTVSLTIAHPGRVLVRVRWSPYWRLSGVAGCVRPAAGGLTRIDATGGGRAQLGMDVTLGRVGSRAPRCN